MKPSDLSVLFSLFSVHVLCLTLVVFDHSISFRVVPPDNLQAEVMAAIVHSVKWRYIWAVGDEGPYGYKGVKSFAEAIDHSVCVAQEFFIPRNAKEKYFDDLIDKMASNERARGAVLFCNEANIRRILLAAERRNRTHQFYWLASDSWGAKQRLVQSLEAVADGAITILPQKELVTDFDVYMRGLTFRCNDPQMTAANPWLQEYWEQINNCSCKSALKKCPDSGSSIVRQYRQEGLVQFVIDSVYAVAHALRNIQRVYCGDHYVGLCANMKRVIYNGTLLRDFIQNVTFFGISKNHVHFNSEGGVEGKYEVYQFRLRKNGSYEYVKTGWWNSKDGLALHQPHVRGADQTFCSRGSHDDPIPVSYCSDPCPPDMGYEYSTDSQCCWHCERCHKNQYLNTSNRKCVECPEDELQSSTSVEECEKIRFVHIEWITIWPCIPILLSGVGLLFNVFILYTLIRYNKTAIIKASGRESSVIMLTGLTATFTTISLQPLWPSTTSCAIMRLGMPVSLTMCYASIFTKTHRIYRIFLPSLNNLIHRPPFISPKSQVIMSLLCTGVSLLLSIVCLTLEPPEVEYLTHNLPVTVVRCRIKNTTFFLTFIYDILVIAATTFLAWQVRHIPENFNEAKYIAFLMYSSCVVWIGLMPIYFIITSNYTVQMTSFLLCITLSAIDIQLCMFLPKMYVVYTGNADLLQQRAGAPKIKFSYATARKQSDGTPMGLMMEMPMERNPASLAMAILKSTHQEGGNRLIGARRHITVSPPETTMVTHGAEAMTPDGPSSNASEAEYEKAAIHTIADSSKNEPTPSEEKKSANCDLRDQAAITPSVKSTRKTEDAATSPMTPLPHSRNSSIAIGIKRTSSSDDTKPNPNPGHSQSTEMFEKPQQLMKSAVSLHSTSSSQSNPKIVLKQRKLQHQQHARQGKAYVNKTASIGPDMEAIPNRNVTDEFESTSHSDAQSLSNVRSYEECNNKVDGAEEEDSKRQLLFITRGLNQRRRSPTLPVRLPEMLLNQAANSTSDNAVYPEPRKSISSSTSLFFGRKRQSIHHLPTQPFNAMKPAGLVVVPPPSPLTNSANGSPNHSAGNTPFGSNNIAKVKSASGKRYTAVAANNNTSTSSSRNSIRAGDQTGSDPRVSSTAANGGCVNGWPPIVPVDQPGKQSSRMYHENNVDSTNRHRLVKTNKHSLAFTGSIDGEHYLPTQMSH